ncbi:alpha-hydroxy-acid oxidizing protein [Shigella flexneri]
MYARRGEVQAAAAADAKGIPFTLSTVWVAQLKKWHQPSSARRGSSFRPRDRGSMRNALERAKPAGRSTLVFTVDMPTPGARYRDAHSGMSGPTPPCAVTGRPPPIHSGRGRGPNGCRHDLGIFPPTSASQPAGGLHRLAGEVT